MTTKTKAPSAQLDKLQRARDDAYATLQDVKRDRSAWEAETTGLKAETSAFINERPEDWADAAHNPKPGTPGAKRRDALVDRLAAGNPHDETFDAARAKFHQADAELQEFLTAHLPDLLAEQEPTVRALEDRRAEVVAAIAEIDAGYAAVEAQARDWIVRTPRLNGQSLKADPRPAQWAKLASENFDAPLAAPGLTADAEWTISNG